MLTVGNPIFIEWTVVMDYSATWTVDLCQETQKNLYKGVDSQTWKSRSI